MSQYPYYNPKPPGELTNNQFDLDKYYESETHVRCRYCYILTSLYEDKNYTTNMLYCSFCNKGLLFSLSGKVKGKKKASWAETFIDDYVKVAFSPPAVKPK